ncbi:MAG: 2-dehydropantoate 2-reductase [Acidimicrobiales bacterium]
MRIGVIGAGAIGSLLAGRLAAAGNSVGVLARGAQLDALRSEGLLIIGEDGSEERVESLDASDDIASLVGADVLVLALKAHQISAMANKIAELYSPNTVVVPVQNGIPWWFFQGLGGPYDGCRLQTLDPDGRISRFIPADRIIGAIAYPASERPRPGVVRVIEGDRFPVGELDGERTDRVSAVAAMLADADFSSRVLTDIRSHLWVKAWGNLAFNPISALTRAGLATICRDPGTRALAAEMMAEAAAIAEVIGVKTRISIDKRIDGAMAVGDHKTSMLQDLEAGRELELGPLVGVFIELGELTGVPTPAIRAVHACASLLDKMTQQT